MKERVKELIRIGQEVIARAQRQGAEVAEVILRDNVDLSAKIHAGAPELIEEAGSSAIGLRVIKGGRSAMTYTSDPSDLGLSALVGDALELAALSEPDPFAMPPEPELLATSVPELSLFDEAVGKIDAGQATHWALAAEKAAKAHDPRINNTDGVSAARTAGAMALVTSGGFAQGYASTYVSLSISALADDRDGKKRIGSDWDARRFVAQMKSPEAIGVEAAKKTLAQLGAEKIPTGELPVVFHPDAGRAFLSLLFSCISGGAIYRRASYLVDQEGQEIASPLVTIVDDPLIPKAPGSRPFDGEGLPSRRTVVVEAGRLRTYLLDTYSAKKLGKASTGSAARGVGSAPSVSPTNFHLLPGTQTPEALWGEVDRGLYVTSMMGFGFNPVTGDFSRGAEGFLIEKGRLTRPVSEVTISLGFKDFWRSIDAVANDLDPKSSYAAPTFRVKKMTVAGQS